ncbi:MAG TPA: hypothetical protein VFI41_04930 [Gemmatimonadales bacterium]|nr:hypothetical protein [Gemmatimonadales bacterium]
MTTDTKPFQLYFQGAEQKGWQRLLLAEGVRNLGISFTYFYRKVKRSNWELPDFPTGTSVLLDSGAFGANKNPGQMDDNGWREYETGYCEFVEDNLDAIDIVAEFDLQQLGYDHIKGMRETFWDGLGSKFMPIWHPHYGMDELERLARRYDRVGVPGSALAELSYLGGRINTLSRQWDTRFHGIALTQPDVLRNVHFATAASTSWISPSKFGDTQVFDGHRLKRYPKRYKDRARRQHKMAFERAGFDAAKILADDPVEVTRFTVWSWRRFEESLAKHRGVTPSVDSVTGEIAPSTTGPVGTSPVLARTEEAVPLPVLNFTPAETLTLAPAETVRTCSNCYVAAQCPAFRPDASCAFNLPVSLRTREQLLGALYSIVEMQVQRVAFGRYTEELEGGYSDPNLSNEVDRLMRLVKELKDIEDTRDTVRQITEIKAGAGVLSRIFGERPQPELPATNGHVIEGEVVEGD